MNPGCYGSVIAHNAEDDTCRACPLRGGCADSAYQNLLSLREQLNVSHYLKQFEVARARAGKPLAKGIETKPAVTRAPRQQYKLGPLELQVLSDRTRPQKARKLLYDLFKRGLSISALKAALRQGVNPFRHETPETMRIACELLLDRGFTRDELIRALMVRGESRKSFDTARSQASVAMAAITMTGLAVELGPRYVMEA